MNGIIYSHIKTGAYNGDQFIEWLECLLKVMNPYPGPNSVLILDNCQIMLKVLKNYVRSGISDSLSILFYCWHYLDRGVKLIYLPPYSPDLNPIEECFSWVKYHIRRHGLEFWNIVETGNEEELFLFLYDILDKVPTYACQGWFHHSGYVWNWLVQLKRVTIIIY